jgi:hypothetical protein
MFDWEPVECLTITGDMRPTRNTGDYATQGVLNTLESFNLLVGEAVEERVTIIDPATNHGVGEKNGNRASKVAPDSVKISDL